MLATIVALLVTNVDAIYILGCNSSGKNGDVAFHDPLKYIGTPGWPGMMEGPYNCYWEISVDPWEAKEYPMLKVSIIDLKSDCSKRSRVWIVEDGKQKGLYTCAQNPMPVYLARSGKVSVGLDVNQKTQILISYQAVKPGAVGVRGPGLQQLRNTMLGSKTSGNGLYQENEQLQPGADPRYIQQNFPTIARAAKPGSGNALAVPSRTMLANRPMGVLIPTEPPVTQSTKSRKEKLDEKLAAEAAAKQKTMRFLIALAAAIILIGLAVVIQGILTRKKNAKRAEVERARREQDLVTRCT